MNNNRKDKMMVKISNITFNLLKEKQKMYGSFDRAYDFLGTSRFIVEDTYVCEVNIFGRECYGYEGDLEGYEYWITWKAENNQALPSRDILLKIEDIIVSKYETFSTLISYNGMSQEEAHKILIEQEEEEKKKYSEELKKRLEAKNPWKEIEVAGLKIKIAPLKDLQS
jgi:hypothetical protein